MPEIETLKSFCNTLQEDTGEDFNSSFAYGDWSDAARWISQGLKNPSEFSKLIKEQDREKFFAQAAANCESANEFEVTNRLRGIVYLSDFLAAKDVKTPVETPESLLKKSVEAFEEAWPSDSLTARSSPCEGTFFRELFEHPVGPEQQNPKKADSNDTFKTAIKKTFNAHAGKRATGIVIDLLRWASSDNALPFREDNRKYRQSLCHVSSPLRSCTPIVLAESNRSSTNGKVVWLTVELFDDAGGGFAPCPRMLGMTSISLVNQSFLTAMDKAWRLAGLDARYRGRWLVTRTPPFDLSSDIDRLAINRNGNDSQKPFFFPHLFGESAQCAALVAILAASGEIRYEDGTFRIDSSHSSDSKPQSLKLVPVSYTHLTLPTICSV